MHTDLIIILTITYNSLLNFKDTNKNINKTHNFFTYNIMFYILIFSINYSPFKFGI